MVIKSALTLAAHEGEVFLRKQEAHKKLLVHYHSSDVLINGSLWRLSHLTYVLL